LRLVFTPHGWDDYLWWVDEDRAIVRRISRLLTDTLRHPYDGTGKPGRLKHALAGAWSRRITGEHRLIYLVDGEDVVVLQARYHY
jgi:toxin YoeB